MRIYTNAHQDFDWGGTILVKDFVAVTEKGEPVRLVETKDDSARSQIDRYGSGLYFGLDESQFSEWVQHQRIILTPDQEVSYCRGVFDLEKGIKDETKRKKLYSLFIELRSMPKVTFKNCSGYNYVLTVWGRTKETEERYKELVQRIETELDTC